MNKLGMKAATVAAALTMGSSLVVLPSGTAKASSNNNQVVIKQLDGSPHNNESFGVTTVAMKGKKILAAKVDEFQFIKTSQSKGFTSVPNSDKKFGQEGYKKGETLISKANNDKAYSALMKNIAHSTKGREESLNAIENYVKGKTASQLYAAAKKNKAMQKKVISGATLTSTNGYVKAIADAATKGYTTKGAKVSGDNVVLKQTNDAPHGNESFAVTTVAMNGDKVAASSIDEFQFINTKQNKGYKGVPNSYAKFGKEGYKSNEILISKQANDKKYSALMKKLAKSKQSRMKSINAINKWAAGKTAAQITTQANKTVSKKSNLVSGATLVDSNNYLKSIAATATSNQ